MASVYPLETNIDAIEFGCSTIQVRLYISSEIENNMIKEGYNQMKLFYLRTLLF